MNEEERPKMSKKKKIGLIFLVLIVVWFGYITIEVILEISAIPCNPIGDKICLETVIENEGDPDERKLLKVKIIDGTGIVENP